MARNRGRNRGTPRHPQFSPGRRRFLTGMAGAAGALALPACGGSPAPAGATGGALPDPVTSGIDHIIVVMMENRSFDHYLGWLPSADGMQAGLRYVDDIGEGHDTYPLAPAGEAGEWQGCAYVDPDHSHEGGARQFNDGACDGFLLGRPESDLYAIGYYTEQNLPFTARAAQAWTVYDRYFCSIMAETYPNRFYQHAAQTPMIHNNIQSAFTNPATIPTVWDRLYGAGLTGTYYYSDLPFIGLWGNKYINNTDNDGASTAQPYSKFLTDAASGLLPDVSFVDPVFTADADRGLSRDDHPHADIRAGQAFLNEVYNAVIGSPQWANTVLFINYDEWGGFFDHVPPPDTGVAPDADRDAAAAHTPPISPVTRMGFRVPTLAISPFARRGHVSHGIYDHCSILKMIQWRWNLAPLTVRDATANNIAESLDLGNPNVDDKPAFEVATGPFGAECESGAGTPATSPAAALARAKHTDEMNQLRLLAQHYGFPVY